MRKFGSEEDLHIQVADYLRLQYPDVLFHSDFGSGAKLTPGQAVRQKRLNGGRRAWPDLYIAEPSITANVEFLGRTFQTEDKDTGEVSFYRLLGKADNAKVDGKIKFKRLFVQKLRRVQAEDLAKSLCAGLYIELKKDGTRLKKKNGDWASEHIAEQAAVLKELRRRGFKAEFAVGFDEAKKIIDEYLKG
jgi:hypothetical protein